MRSVIAVLIVCATAGVVAAAPARLVGRVTDTVTGRPVEGATVHISRPHVPPRVAVTDADGRYRADLEPGTYDVLVVYGATSATGRITVRADAESRVDARIDARSGEVIELEGIHLPRVPPAPKNYSIRKVPPYSSRAVLGDAWTRAWLLLEVGADGRVTRFKFLKHPGYGLDDIATAEAFKLRFTPARGATGAAVRGWMLWGIEWPSNSYLVMTYGTATRMPNPAQVQRSIPCRGSGPWSGGYYRDCSEPDWKRAAVEPWIAYDPARPAPATAWD